MLRATLVIQSGTWTCFVQTLYCKVVVGRACASFVVHWNVPCASFVARSISGKYQYLENQMVENVSSFFPVSKWSSLSYIIIKSWEEVRATSAPPRADTVLLVMLSLLKCWAAGRMSDLDPLPASSRFPCLTLPRWCLWCHYLLTPVGTCWLTGPYAALCGWRHSLQSTSSSALRWTNNGKYRINMFFWCFLITFDPQA